MKLCLLKKSLILTTSVFIFDRITKLAAQNVLREEGIEVFKFLHFNYVQNTGAAFGIMKDANTFLIVITTALIGFVIFSAKHIKQYGSAAETGMYFIVGGALGNLFDRIFIGSVIDFIDFRIWPVFNIADSFISIGAVIIGWQTLFGKSKTLEAK